MGTEVKKRALGLDYGSKTVGVAVSDGLGITAQGVEIIRRTQENKLRKTLARIEKKVDALREEQEAANRKTILKGAFSGGLSGVLVSAAVSYAQLLLGVK